VQKNGIIENNEYYNRDSRNHNPEEHPIVKNSSFFDNYTGSINQSQDFASRKPKTASRKASDHNENPNAVQNDFDRYGNVQEISKLI
jgi:hypothetical protein